jgi:polar amino acid transport system substrate-binding protein
MRAGRVRSGALVGLVLAVALVAAGCGNKSETGGGSTGTTVKAPAVDEALAAKVPAAIKSDGKIVIGTDASYAPNEFLDTDGKTVIGFDVDLFNAVAAKLGLKTEYESAVFDAIIPGLQSGKYEAGVSSFTINDERKKQVNMVSYFQAGTQWATQKGNPKKVDPANACGLTIAVQTATVQAEEDLPKRQADCKKAGKPAIKVQSYTGQDEATAAVGSKKADAMLADSPIAAYAVKQTKGTLQLLGDVYDSAPYGYVVPKEQTEFATAITEALKGLKEDGTYDSVLKNWGVEGGAIDAFAVNP